MKTYKKIIIEDTDFKSEIENDEDGDWFYIHLFVDAGMREEFDHIIKPWQEEMFKFVNKNKAVHDISDLGRVDTYGMTLQMPITKNNKDILHDIFLLYKQIANLIMMPLILNETFPE